jgi:hypothetical protein
MTYTTEQTINFVKAARLRHEGRVDESERQYRDDVLYVRKGCPHEFTDVRHVIDFNDCSIHVTYCTACGKEMD